MKKILSIILLLVLMLTASVSFADAQADFFQFVEDLRSSAPDGFFKSEKQIFHSPFLKINKTAEELFASSETRHSETALRFTEVQIVSILADQSAELFGDREISIDLTKPSYIGRDGSILSSYVQGPDCGFFMLYDLASQIMYLDFIPFEQVDQVENVWFAKCADGYYANEADILKTELEKFQSYYDATMEHFGL